MPRDIKPRSIDPSPIDDEVLTGKNPGADLRLIRDVLSADITPPTPGMPYVPVNRWLTWAPARAATPARTLALRPGSEREGTALAGKNPLQHQTQACATKRGNPGN